MEFYEVLVCVTVWAPSPENTQRSEHLSKLRTRDLPMWFFGIMADVVFPNMCGEQRGAYLVPGLRSHSAILLCWAE